MAGIVQTSSSSGACATHYEGYVAPYGASFYYRGVPLSQFYLFSSLSTSGASYVCSSSPPAPPPPSPYSGSSSSSSSSATSPWSRSSSASSPAPAPLGPAPASSPPSPPGHVGFWVRTWRLGVGSGLSGAGGAGRALTLDGPCAGGNPPTGGRPRLFARVLR